MTTLTKDEKKQKIAQLLGEHKTAMMVTRNDVGDLVSRPMTVQQHDFDGDVVWFFVSADADVVDEIQTNALVNISYYNDNNYVSLSGEATIVDDDKKKRELWYTELKRWFNGAGPDSEYVKLIEVELDTGRYWEVSDDKRDGAWLKEGMVDYYNR